MIDIVHENVMTLEDAAAWWSERIGRRRDAGTLRRWAKHGKRGGDGGRYHLETVHDGARLVTSAEAIQRFFDRLMMAAWDAEKPAPQPARRRGRSEAKLRQRLGVLS